MALKYKVPVEEVLGRSRRRDVCRARHVSVWLAREVAGLRWVEMCKLFGRSRHAVWYSMERVTQAMQVEEGFGATLDRWVGEVRRAVGGRRGRR